MTRPQTGEETMISELKPRFLMCRPEHFGVVYAINPWMNPRDWEQEEHALAEQSRKEWTGLQKTLAERGAIIDLVPAAPGVPDLVFTANSAVVLDRKALLARFRYPQRRGEESHFRDTFRSLQARGLLDAVRTLPDDVVLEGAGDCVWDGTRKLFWTGYGPRSDLAARATVEAIFGVETLPLQLTDPRFYHLDTALCPLPHGDVMYVPEAFTAEGRALIRDNVAKEQRIEIGMDDASRLAANAVSIGDTLVMSACSPGLRTELEGRGYRVATVPLGSFLRSGGAAFCLTLRLDLQSDRAPQRLTAARR
jgi:N-dimethylarginine dimethylaminohydrolase